MVLVVGMARSGVAAAKLLQAKGFSVFVTDAGNPKAAAAELDAAGIPYETEHHTRLMFLEAEEIVVSPGVPLDIEPLAAARASRVPIISELELAFRYIEGQVVAITGSNGKTTTTTLIGEMLTATGRHIQVGGNIGVAMTGLVATSTPKTINVVEVSSFQLDAIRAFRPDVGVLMNITPDHLDRYSGFQAYRASKFRLFENQTENDIAVLNRDDANVYPPLRLLRAKQRLFSQKIRVDEGAFREGDSLFLNGSQVMNVGEVKVPGAHNIENILAAMTAASCLGVAAASLAQTAREFRGVEHRIELCGEIGGVKFYNDSKATNVDSTIKAVESFEKDIILILGGKDKGASYAPLVDVMKGRVKHVLLIGAAAQKISDAIGNAFPKTFVSTMEDAVEKGLSMAQPGDSVLLSPACASFDMFENYEHRGRVFKEAVKRLE
jgi:UDP-N-acetylmuramoylalanine--D-glutamate ligase